MEKLEIKKEDALKAHDEATSKGKVLLENLLGKKVFQKKVTDRIKTIYDVLEDNGFTEELWKNMFLNTPNHIKYQYLAELLVKSLNEGWTPNWDDSSEYKYFPWFLMSSSEFRFDDYGGWSTSSNVGSHLCFKSSELATYAGEQFTEVYKEFMLIK